MKVVLPVLILIACMLTLSCNNDNSTGSNGPLLPTVTGFTPANVNRGNQNVNGKITGTNFTNVTAVNLGDGITVKSFNANSSTQITVIFAVSRNAAVGAHVITVTTAAGTATSSGNLFSVERSNPVAVITSNATGNTIEPVHFSGSKSYSPDGGGIVNYTWDFGDGSKKANGEQVDHKFASNGTYTVTLTVADAAANKGSDTKKVDIAKVTEQVCGWDTVIRLHPGGHQVSWGPIIGVDPAGYNVLMKIPTADSCRDAFYHCGNLKESQQFGNVNAGPEYQYGVVCNVSYLGDHLFRVYVGHKVAPPKDWPPRNLPRKNSYMSYRTCTDLYKFCPDGQPAIP